MWQIHHWRVPGQNYDKEGIPLNTSGKPIIGFSALEKEYMVQNNFEGVEEEIKRRQAAQARRLLERNDTFPPSPQNKSPAYYADRALEPIYNMLVSSYNFVKLRQGYCHKHISPQIAPVKRDLEKIVKLFVVKPLMIIGMCTIWICKKLTKHILKPMMSFKVRDKNLRRDNANEFHIDELRVRTSIFTQRPDRTRSAPATAVQQLLRRRTHTRDSAAVSLR